MLFLTLILVALPAEQLLHHPSQHLIKCSFLSHLHAMDPCLYVFTHLFPLHAVNPIHLHSSLSKLFGFKRPIAHALFQLSCTEASLRKQGLCALLFFLRGNVHLLNHHCLCVLEQKLVVQQSHCAVCHAHTHPFVQLFTSLLQVSPSRTPGKWTWSARDPHCCLLHCTARWTSVCLLREARCTSLSSLKTRRRRCLLESCLHRRVVRMCDMALLETGCVLFRWQSVGLVTCTVLCECDLICFPFLLLFEAIPCT